jgi:hypothetical protein
MSGENIDMFKSNTDCSHECSSDHDMPEQADTTLL